MTAIESSPGGIAAQCLRDFAIIFVNLAKTNRNLHQGDEQSRRFFLPALFRPTCILMAWRIVTHTALHPEFGQTAL